MYVVPRQLVNLEVFSAEQNIDSKTEVPQGWLATTACCTCRWTFNCFENGLSFACV